MYKAIAQQKFPVCPLGAPPSAVRDYLPGDIIHDFFLWPEQSRRALVGSGFVRVLETLADGADRAIDLGDGTAQDVARQVAAVSQRQETDVVESESAVPEPAPDAIATPPVKRRGRPPKGVPTDVVG